MKSVDERVFLSFILEFFDRNRQKRQRMFQFFQPFISKSLEAHFFHDLSAGINKQHSQGLSRMYQQFKDDKKGAKMPSGSRQNLKSEIFWRLQQILKQLLMPYMFFMQNGANPFEAFSSLHSMYLQLGLNNLKPDRIEDQAFGMPLMQAMALDTNASFPGFEPLECQLELLPSSKLDESEYTECKETKEIKEVTNLEKEIMSAKKNSQSNIINQFYSFFSHREKSEKLVERVLKHMGLGEHGQQIISIFYATVRFINVRRGRKYVNLSCLFRLFKPQELLKYLPEIRERVQKSGYVGFPVLCSLFRRCAKLFLADAGVSAILTSKRISLASKHEHVKRLRKIQKNLPRN